VFAGFKGNSSVNALGIIHGIGQVFQQSSNHRQIRLRGLSDENVVHFFNWDLKLRLSFWLCRIFVFLALTFDITNHCFLAAALSPGTSYPAESESSTTSYDIIRASADQAPAPGLPQVIGMVNEKSLIPVERIEKAILLIRGQKVMLDAHLAELYGVETKVLVQAVKRNIERFPEDFMFQLSQAEFAILRSQFVTSSDWGGRRYPPYAFTEQGVAMLSSVLHSQRAVQVNIEIVRAFIRLRQMLASHVELARKLDALEKKYDAQFRQVFEAIRQLMAPPEPKRRPIGFRKGDG